MLPDNFDPFVNFNPFNMIGKSSPSFSCYYDKEKKENVLSADLPGLDSSNISIKLEGNKKIVVNGSRPCYEDRIYLFTQPWCGNFNYEIQLNKDVNSRDLSTSYKNGVVTISISNQKDNIVNGIQSKIGNDNNITSSYSRSF